MEHSGSTLEIFDMTFEKDMQQTFGDENVAVQMEIDSDTRGSIPMMVFHIYNEDYGKSINIGLGEIHCKQIVSFLQSHLRGQ